MPPGPPLPKLLDARTLAEELGVKQGVAETLMQQLPKYRIGRRVFVDRQDVRRFLDENRVDKDGFPPRPA